MGDARNYWSDCGQVFFCEACLTGKPESERSPKDIRYCLECQPFLEVEYKLRGEKYIPILNTQLGVVTESKSGVDNTQPVETYTEQQKTKMSILTEKPSTMDNFRPRGRPKTYKKRSLPGDKIKQLHQDGIGATAIASLLKREYGIDVSYKTIQRVLTGKRK
ncbi:hypothetical protein ES703_88662 [subsurface metagenome]